MDDQKPMPLNPPMDYFPMDSPREKQVRALDFVRRAHLQNYTDIVIAAPTGIGKTGIGAAIAFWAQQDLNGPNEKFEPGAYYLVTQKLLQDQLEDDIAKFKKGFQRGCTLKSASAYPCEQYETCMVGLRMKRDKRCRAAMENHCTYRGAKGLFKYMPLAVTNYPYFFTERTYVGEFPPRSVLIADECHTLEKQILGFVEVNINNELIDEWAPQLRPIKKMDDIFEFADWLAKKYMPSVLGRIEALSAKLEANPGDSKAQDELTKAESHHGRNTAALKSISEDHTNWIYWQELKDGNLECIAKPISAAAFRKFLISDAAKIRVYMSAYPGPKEIFCRSLGLEPSKVAWLNLSSTFPIKNRLVHLMMVGSMGQKNYESTLPSILRMCERILNAHSKEKGLIHCHSYRIGQALFDYLNDRFPGRIIFPTAAKDRDSSFAYHASTEEPTVMLSPSMTEGFNLIEDLARFQIIAKVPYPYLGDKQVAAKKDRDPSWYSMQTAMTIIQACGRIVRSDTDFGATYILDSDFQMLYERNPDFFPQWFEEAFVWHHAGKK
jgi:ATP-dependent DNA helicase DinG